MLKQENILRTLIASASGLALLLLLLPPLALVARGIDTRAWNRLPDSGIPEAVILSLMTTSISAGVIIVLGTPLAFVLARWNIPFKSSIVLLVQMPIVLPPAVAGLALLVAFGQRGVLGPSLAAFGIELSFSTAAVVIAQVFVSAPLYIRSAQVGFQNIPREVEEAAKVDGAHGITMFWHIIMPLSSRAMAVGLTLSWTRALGEFGATILFAGSQMGRTQTMPLLVYNVIERGDIDAAIWTGLILIGIALFALGILQMFSRHLDRSNEMPAEIAVPTVFH